MVCCGKRIIQEGPPFVPPQGDRIKGMGGSGLLGKSLPGTVYDYSQTVTRGFSKW